jgi:hypothetical protein
VNRSTLALTLALLVASTVDGTAQRRPGASVAPSKPLSVSARIDGKTYEATGPGRCKHASEASIYDIPAALWMVEYGDQSSDRIKQLSLILWRPEDGSSDQISLSLQVGTASHRIESGGKGPSVGSAAVNLIPVGSGGRFELKGKDAEGKKVELTIGCPAFTGVEAEGG